MNDETRQPDLLADLGLENLSEDERHKLLAEIGGVVYRGVVRRAWNTLSIKEQDELSELLEASAADSENEEKSTAVDTFLNEHVTDLSKYVAEEVEALKKAQQSALSEFE